MDSVLAKSWHDHSRGLIGWIIGVAGLAAMTIVFWPTIQGNADFQKALDQIPDSLKFLLGEDSLTSPAGYLNSQLYAYTIPILMLIYAIGQGSDSIAGEEQRHTMDLLLSHPITRRSVVLQKFGATSIGLLLMTAVLIVSAGLGIPFANMDIPVANIAAASIGCMLLGMHFGALALAIGAATGKKPVAMGIASAVATAAFFVDSLAPQVDQLEPIRKLSAFYYYSGAAALREGFQWGHFAVLVVTAGLFLAAAIWLFDRRDVAL